MINEKKAIVNEPSVSETMQVKARHLLKANMQHVFSTSSTRGETSQKGQSALCKHCNLCSPNKHKVRHLVAKPQPHTGKIYKHWNDVKTTV